MKTEETKAQVEAETGLETPGININDLEWRCRCGGTRSPPSHGGYMPLTMSKAHKKHMKKLVNKKTGEFVATSRPDAESKQIPLLRREQPLPLPFPLVYSLISVQ